MADTRDAHVDAKICVVGAALIDLISYVPRLPRVGETLHGKDFSMGFGGKGANQAVMAAKLGAQVSLVTALGRDVFGDGTLANLRSFGIDTANILVVEGAPSGVAPITVDESGANAIIIVTGANDLLGEREVEQARAAIAAADVLICQLEIPLAATRAALRIAREESTRTILNPAPARADLPADLFELADVFCPNESETELLLGRPLAPGEEEAAASSLLERGAGSVILTLGERGCLVHTAETSIAVPAERVDVKDTTGAGDAFVASLAYFLATGRPLVEAAVRANHIASVSVQARGTQTSFPDRACLPTLATWRDPW